jgi:hypothetical protein
MSFRRLILVLVLVLTVGLMVTPAKSDTLWQKIKKSSDAALYLATHPKNALDTDKWDWECINDGPICYPSPTPP